MAREGTNVTVNIPDILMGHARKAVNAKKEEVAAYSMGDLIRDALRGLLTPDGPVVVNNYVGYEVPAGTYVKGQVMEGRKLTAVELAAKFGIKTGATIEEVEPGLPGGLVPGAPPQSLLEPTDSQTLDPDLEQRNLFIGEFGRQAWDRAIRIPSFKKAKWPERFEMAREQKERGE